MNALLIRATVAFLACPGIVAFVVPLWLVRQDRLASAGMGGLIPFAVGTVLLLWCVREFYASGRGTLAPWDPPRSLVVRGPYRFSRNPMYVAVLLVLCGWTLMFLSRTVAIYAAAVAVAFHVRVTMFEEPWLARTHPDDWARYQVLVPRWLGFRRRTTAP